MSNTIAEYKSGNFKKVFIQLEDGFAIGDDNLESEKLNFLEDIKTQKIKASTFDNFRIAKINWMNRLSIAIEDLEPKLIDLGKSITEMINEIDQENE